MNIESPVRILFVCMGNICRSPSAEGYFRHHLAQSSLSGRITFDSAGTHGYHVGNSPDDRAQATMARRGIDISDLRARKVRITDFSEFDLIIAMDEDNLQILESMDDGGGAKLVLMMRYSDQFDDHREVPDPYYGGQDGFDYMCDLLDEATRGLLVKLEAGGS